MALEADNTRKKNPAASVHFTAQQVEAIAAHIRDTYGEDDDLVLGMVEGETDAGELLDTLIEGLSYDKSIIGGIKEWEAALKERRQRMEKRSEARREGIRAILDAAGLSKWERPLATVSVRNVPPKRVVRDVDALPDEFVTIVRKPNMAAIKDAEITPAGCEIDNGDVSLTVRVR